jgi:hypothetical protein
MRGLNLRGDLARLSDAELAKHLEETIEALDTTRPTRGIWFLVARLARTHPASDR